MTRNFEVQVEVIPCTDDELTTLTAQMREWGMSVEDQTEAICDERGEGRAFWGSRQLSGGESEDAAHQQLAAQFPDRWVRTRWRCIDDLPWDEDIESEPLQNPISLSA